MEITKLLGDIKYEASGMRSRKGLARLAGQVQILFKLELISNETQDKVLRLINEYDYELVELEERARALEARARALEARRL